jgi:putative SOS response-associated peptidase YedK
MCERVIQTAKAYRLGLEVVHALEEPGGADDDRGEPSQSLWVIRRNPETGEHSIDRLAWGLIPSGFEEPPERPFRVARAETVASLPAFRQAYAKRRAIMPVDDAFEWRATKGPAPGQPFGIAMKDGSSYGVASIWENWRDPRSRQWIRTFAILTIGANELISEIHDRMPVILHPSEYERWLGGEPDPDDLLQQYPAELMVVRPQTRRRPASRKPATLFDLV